MPAREWWTCSIPSACARSGILAVCLIACRRNAARMSMIPFSLVGMCAKSMCYNRRAYAPRTRVLAWSGIATAADIEQTTGGPCSPAINGNHNTVNCSGVDPRAMARLEELLDMKDRDLKQKIADANEWTRKYNELNAQLTEARRQLTAKGEDATLV